MQKTQWRPRLVFCSKTTNADHVVQRGLETAALEMKPTEGCRTVVQWTGEYLFQTHGPAGWRDGSLERMWRHGLGVDGGPAMVVGAIGKGGRGWMTGAENVQGEFSGASSDPSSETNCSRFISSSSRGCSNARWGGGKAQRHTCMQHPSTPECVRTPSLQFAHERLPFLVGMGVAEGWIRERNSAEWLVLPP
jgi:hypothetical protein